MITLQRAFLEPRDGVRDEANSYQHPPQSVQIVSRDTKSTLGDFKSLLLSS